MRIAWRHSIRVDAAPTLGATPCQPKPSKKLAHRFNHELPLRSLRESGLDQDIFPVNKLQTAAHHRRHPSFPTIPTPTVGDNSRLTDAQIGMVVINLAPKPRCPPSQAAVAPSPKPPPTADISPPPISPNEALGAHSPLQTPPPLSQHVTMIHTGHQKQYYRHL